jgi:hypothetical protein
MTVTALNVFNHFSKYAELPELQGPEYEVVINSEIEGKFWEFAAKRMNIYHKKSSGQPGPWTDDEILQNFYFTNCYRELDKTTVLWNKLLEPVKDNMQLLFLNTAYMRFCGRPETIVATGLMGLDQAQAESAKLKEVYDNLPDPRNTSAYLFPIAGALSLGYKDRPEFFFYHLPKIALESSEIISRANDAPIGDVVADLVKVMGFGARFHLSEILMDIGYIYPNLINEFKEFPIGPGAEPICKELNKKANSRHVALTLMKNQPTDFPHLVVNGKKVMLTAANVEQCLCEFRKYNNLVLGIGRRRFYRK